MIATLLGAWALFVGMALIMLGHGLQSSLLGLRATLEGFETLTTGLVMSSYAAGYAAGSLITPRFIARVGHVRVFAAFASTASARALETAPEQGRAQANPRPTTERRFRRCIRR